MDKDLKKADLVLFEFTSHFDGIKRALEKLSDKRLQGYFFYSAEKKYYAF